MAKHDNACAVSLSWAKTWNRAQIFYLLLTFHCPATWAKQAKQNVLSVAGKIFHSQHAHPACFEEERGMKQLLESAPPTQPFTSDSSALSPPGSPRHFTLKHEHTGNRGGNPVLLSVHLPNLFWRSGWANQEEVAQQSDQLSTALPEGVYRNLCTVSE